MTCGSLSQTLNIVPDLTCTGLLCYSGRADNSLSLTANGDTALNLPSGGGSVNLVWTTSNLASTGCTATSSDGLWSGSKSYLGGSNTITVPANTSTTTTVVHSYTMSGCLNVATSILVPSQTVTVTVARAGVPTLISFNANGVDSSSSLIMTSGGLLTLSWQVQNVSANSCVGTSSGSFSGWNSTTKLPSSSVTTAQTFVDYLGSDGSITSDRTYTLNCGTAGTKTVTINVEPPIVDTTTCVGLSCGSLIGPPSINATKRPPWLEI